jgi:hypothetical protein
LKSQNKKNPLTADMPLTASLLQIDRNPINGWY